MLAQERTPKHPPVIRTRKSSTPTVRIKSPITEKIRTYSSIRLTHLRAIKGRLRTRVRRLQVEVQLLQAANPPSRLMKQSSKRKTSWSSTLSNISKSTTSFHRQLWTFTNLLSLLARVHSEKSLLVSINWPVSRSLSKQLRKLTCKMISARERCSRRSTY